jgi:hypothetical protein
MYDPTVGRWLNLDPLGFDAGDANHFRGGECRRGVKAGRRLCRGSARPQLQLLRVGRRIAEPRGRILGDLSRQHADDGTGGSRPAPLLENLVDANNEFGHVAQHDGLDDPHSLGAGIRLDFLHRLPQLVVKVLRSPGRCGEFDVRCLRRIAQVRFEHFADANHLLQEVFRGRVAGNFPLFDPFSDGGHGLDLI